MLIFGSSGGDWQEKARYAEDKADNEFAKVREVRCEGIEDVQTAMATMAAFAADTKCKKFLYHATINLNPGERLTPEQWKEAVDRLEEKLNLKTHHRVLFEHIKKDRQHYHIYWSRLPPNGGAAVSMSNDYITHQKTAKELEKHFALKPAPRKAKDQPSKKKRQINDKNSGVRIAPELVTKDVTRIYRESPTTQDFMQNLQKEGYVLTHGKNGSYVLVDKQGGYHGLLRRIKGVKLGDVESKYPELKKMPLPPLNDVLRIRRGASSAGFKKAARFAKRGKSRAYRARRLRQHKSKSAKRTTTPWRWHMTRSLAAAKREHSFTNRKYYPLPFKRRIASGAAIKSASAYSTSKGVPKPIKVRKGKSESGAVTNKIIHPPSLSPSTRVKKIARTITPHNSSHPINPASGQNTHHQHPVVSHGGGWSMPPVGKAPPIQPYKVVRQRNEQREEQKPEPFKPVKNSGGWPEAALMDWLAWGYKDPAAFFAKWPELGGGGNGPSPG